MARSRKIADVEATVEKQDEEVEVTETQAEDIAFGFEDEDDDGDLLPIPENLEELIEQANKPPLAEGQYIAALVKVEGKLNEETLSYGYWWTWLINSGDFKEDGWDKEAKTFELRQYTYLGKMVGGKLQQTNGGFSATNVLASLGVVKTLNTEKVRGRQVVVQIRHRKDQNDDSRVFMEVAKTFPYFIGEEKAPVLKMVKESRPAEAAKPAASNSGSEW